MSKKSRRKNAAKKKKEKVVYYDDNSTIFDMSGVRDSRRRGSSAGASDGSRGGHAPRSARQNNPYGEKKSATFKEKWKTYVAAVKMMFPWMCLALIAIGVLYFVVVFFGRCSA